MKESKTAFKWGGGEGGGSERLRGLMELGRPEEKGIAVAFK